MVQILVFDDDGKECRWAKETLESFAREEGKNVTVRTVSDEESLMKYVESNAGLDIIFLDICVGEEAAGIEMARKINAVWPDILIVFLTGYLVYATDVYDTSHIYFVLKEEFKKRLPGVFAKLESAIEERDKGYIHVPVRGKEIVVREEDICYIERRGRNTQIVCKERTVEVSEKLSELEEKLSQASFVRCHNSFIVNLNAVRELRRTEIVLEDGGCVPVSRNRLEKTRERFLSWMR